MHDGFVMPPGGLKSGLKGQLVFLKKKNNDNATDDIQEENDNEPDQADTDTDEKSDEGEKSV